MSLVLCNFEKLFTLDYGSLYSLSLCLYLASLRKSTAKANVKCQPSSVYFQSRQDAQFALKKCNPDIFVTSYDVKGKASFFCLSQRIQLYLLAL